MKQTRHSTVFELFGTQFEIPLLGEFNVRNAAMAASAAHFYGVPMTAIQHALATFEGVKRRQEIRGVVRGVTIIDDFGHHPTAIRQTLAGLRARYQTSKIWALFEPRSNTTRRKVFQHELPAAFADADGVFISKVARLEQIPVEDRLNPEQVVADIAATGKPAHYSPGADEIVATLKPLVADGDIVVVFSNGGFEGIHDKLLKGL
jgi:UDP-N-acetylmuramate: L-alanyl-gamma-D-glutamyl-meso-diaminopimelate ligase